VAPAKAPEADYMKGSEESLEELEEVRGEGIIGVEELAEFLDMSIERTTKTILFNVNEEYYVAAAIRGGYEIDEEKLQKVLEADSMRMATSEEVKEITCTVVGYVGPLDLDENVKVIFDDSCDNRVNFECGANKENFHTINVNWGRDLEKPEEFFDIKVAQAGDLNPKNGKEYKTYAAAEVGNIFPLETKFSEAFKMNYVDEENQELPVFMGSYGIGTTRVMGVIAEIMNDENGLIWPTQIAPYHLHLITIGDDMNERAEKLIGDIEKDISGIEILWDDREGVNPGEKFADADLIGIPVRVVLSSRSLEKGGVEVSRRTDDEKFGEIMDIRGLIEFLEGEFNQGL
jgi:prolyl-tRNA synthetase